MKIQKISENVYEIPKEGKMNVPVRVYASEKILESIKKDKTLEQARNMAMMPGVVKQVVVLPDAHQGYGACIGGVSAYDLKKGVVSPGQTGYDINCLTGDSLIINEFGGCMKIENFEKLQSELEIEDNGRKLKKIIFSNQINTLNMKSKIMESKPINLIMSRDNDKLSEITLNSGLKIRATEDHPFLTKHGMKNISDLKIEDFVAVDLFEGISINEQITEKDAILSKFIGYMFGDGSFVKSKYGIRASAYGQEEDLKTIKRDLARIGVNSYIYSRSRYHSIQTKYNLIKFSNVEYSLHINSQEFNHLLEERGLVLGNKTRQEVRIPEWIKKSNLLIKRLFLAGFFGAEMSTPKTSSKTCFFCPTIDQNKIEALRQNARDFLIDISLLLEEFGIKETSISEFEDFHNKYGEKTRRFRLLIKGEDNMLKLWRKIGFEYNNKRRNIVNIASLYILLKKQETNKRRELSQKIKEYRKKGFKISEVKNILINKINERFVERSYYENAGQRINLDFISFKDFKRNKLAELKKYGVIFDNIMDKKEIFEKCKVYDFNIQDNHNFIANGFVVSNCGVRLIVSDIKLSDFMKKRKEIMKSLGKDIPSGVGVKSGFSFSPKEIDLVLKNGVKWAFEKGFATKEDVLIIEDEGCISGADSSKVSARAKGRGMHQLGSLGAGNHFMEIGVVEEIYDKKTANVFGIDCVGKVTFLIHSGSRGLGHQVASDYIKKMEEEYGFDKLPDRELACAPINSELGKNYLSAMRGAANFGFVNRQLLTFSLREIIKKYFPKNNLDLIYDIAHNIVKIEKYNINGKMQEICVHRKGATRSFGPGRLEIPLKYRKIGSPIFIPGSMGTYSYVLVGTKKAEELTFGSTAHGAGRLMSRSEASRTITPESLAREMSDKDIILESGSLKGAVDEAPSAYKDVNEVVRVSDTLGIGKMVARLKPLGVVKG